MPVLPSMRATTAPLSSSPSYHQRRRGTDRYLSLRTMTSTLGKDHVRRLARPTQNRVKDFRLGFIKRTAKDLRVFEFDPYAMQREQLKRV